MTQIHSKKIINNIFLPSSLTKKNKKSIFLYKKQKSYNFIIPNDKRYLKFKKTLEFDFLSLNNNLLLKSPTRNVSRDGFKKLVSSFLIRSGKSKKLENKIFSSYIYFSKKYPEYWLDKHIELFFSKYAFPLIYLEKYRIFKKRRSKKPHFSRQSLNTIAEQKYIFNFFKEFLSKKLTRNFKSTFQYHFLTLTSDKLGLSSVQKSRTKENISKWNRFSKTARIFRKEKRKDFLNKRKTSVNVTNKKSFKKLKISHKFLKNTLHYYIKKDDLLNNQRSLYKNPRYFKDINKPRQVYWTVSKNLKNMHKSLSWRVSQFGINYRFLFSNNFFDSYKDYLYNFSSKVKKPFLNSNVKIDGKNSLDYKNTNKIFGKKWSSLRIGKKGLYSLKFKPSYTFFLKNNKEWFLKKNEQKFLSKYERKKKKKIYNNFQKVFTTLNKSYITLKYINLYSKWNINSNIGSLKFLDLISFNNLSTKKIEKKKVFKFIKNSEQRKLTKVFNENKIGNYKNFYIKQKIKNSFKSNRYNNFLGKFNKDLLVSNEVNGKFKLSTFLKQSSGNLIFNLEKAIQKKNTYPFFNEEKKIVMGLQHEKVFNSKGRRKSILSVKSYRLKFFNKNGLNKYEKSFKHSISQKRYFFKPKYSLILNNLNSKYFYQENLQKNKTFPLMFKLKDLPRFLIYVEGSSKNTILKVLDSFENFTQTHFDKQNFDVTYDFKKEKIKRLSLLTSPHVNKIAQQHFEKTSNKCIITVKFLNQNTLNINSLIKWIKILNKSSFMCKITLKVKHL